MSAASPSGAALARWCVPQWNFPGLRHAFFGRVGGVSEGSFSSLNCSERVGDDSEAVSQNRRRASAAMRVDGFVLPVQVHGDRVSAVDEADAPHEADGLITAAGAPAVGILTADCVPILLIAPTARLAAAVHAGWKGTALGIAARAVERLCREGDLTPDALHAGLGPAIGGCCYEVGEEVAAALGAGTTKMRVDLRARNAATLRAAGIPEGQIQLVGPCTRCRHQELFSHRASGGRAGRQLSAVGWF
jgi:YfiH family protein